MGAARWAGDLRRIDLDRVLREHLHPQRDGPSLRAAAAPIPACTRAARRLLTGCQWDGTSGGILAFTVQTQLTIAGGGRIVTSAGGFRGGPGVQWRQNPTGVGWPGERDLGLPAMPSGSPDTGGGGPHAGGGGYAVAGEAGVEDYPGLTFGYGGFGAKFPCPQLGRRLDRCAQCCH